MYRRIEFIHPATDVPARKTGLLGTPTEEIADAWATELRGPNRVIPANSRFYFTEKGWREVGRKVIAAAQREGQEYRVIAIKETDAEVIWRDKATGLEVAVQPRRRPRKREVE